MVDGPDPLAGPSEPEFVSRLVEHGRLRHVLADTTVLDQDERTSRAYVVRTGAVRLCREVHAHCVTVQVARPGEVFGAVPWLRGSFELLKARTLVASALVEIPGDTVVQLLGAHPREANAWLQMITSRTTEMRRRLWAILHEEAAVDVHARTGSTSNRSRVEEGGTSRVA